MRAALLLCAALLAPEARAQAVIDDSDLSQPAISAAAARALPREGRRERGKLVFGLARQGGASKTAGADVAGVLLLPDGRGAEAFGRAAKVRLIGKGASETWKEVDAAGRFTIPSGGLSGLYALRVSLDNRLWRFRSGSGEAYEWESAPIELSGTGADAGVLRPAGGTENAKLAVLHATYLQALDYLAANGDVSWWEKTLEIRWPGSGDFFSPWGFTLDITNPLAWDVVLHELGHAVMHGAMRAAGAGGQHKIDECYSEALAWSEGWATFFAAAVRLSPADADARFEYLVPRRAPIRLENVPADVCAGPTNEWRVAAGLWDLLDAHDDGGDRFAMPFPQVWAALRGQKTGGVTQAWELLARRLNAPEARAAREALIHNSLLPPRPALQARLSLPIF